MNDDAIGYYQEEKSTWSRRFWRRLYPSQHLSHPDLVEPFKGIVTIEVVSEFSWLERVRFLISGRMFVLIYALTENDVGNSLASGVAYPLPPKRVVK